jgi:DNA-binding response OmpR family regulator
MKVLIADDDKVFVELVVSRLRVKKHQVFSALDAIQAFMLAVRNQPDVIILDINMPGGTGIDALGKLKTSSKTSGIPVIVVSGTGDPRVSETVLGLGASLFLPKPVAFEVLADAVGRLVGTPVG